MKKFLKFETAREECAGETFVANNKNEWLGTLKKGECFKKRMVLTEVERDVELTSECLRQIADKLNELEGKK